MSTSRYLGAALAMLAVAACSPFSRQAAVEVSAIDPTLNTRWHANVVSPSTLAGAVQMSGTASMAPGPDGNTIVTLDMANASPGGIHPWAVRVGQCGAATDGGAFGAKGVYQPLRIGSDGTVHATASVPLQINERNQYHVEVRASEANPDLVVACGNLAPPTG
jgi:hypothetical protein